MISMNKLCALALGSLPFLCTISLAAIPPSLLLVVPLPKSKSWIHHASLEPTKCTHDIVLTDFYVVPRHAAKCSPDTSRWCKAGDGRTAPGHLGPIAVLARARGFFKFNPFLNNILKLNLKKYLHNLTLFVSLVQVARLYRFVAPHALA
jgi:hypothetical protein